MAQMVVFRSRKFDLKDGYTAVKSSSNTWVAYHKSNPKQAVWESHDFNDLREWCKTDAKNRKLTALYEQLHAKWHGDEKIGEINIVTAGIMVVVNETLYFNEKGDLVCL